MSECDEIRELMQAYAEDELGPRERSRVEAHLADCAACRRRVAGYRALFAALDEPALPAPPADFAARVAARVAAGRRRRALWQSGVLAAAVAIAAAVGLLAGWDDAVATVSGPLSTIGTTEGLSDAAAGLLDVASGLIGWLGEALTLAPGGLLVAAGVAVLLGADLLLAYHWRRLARLDGSRQLRVTQ